MSAVHRFFWGLGENEAALVHLNAVVLEFGHSILFLHLWVVDSHERPILQQHIAHTDCRGLAHVARVFLNAKPRTAIFLWV